ncbi:MAG TPA: M1 family metallopeptidase [Anaerolineales bacterium]|nr:M1 family metallopeptidase [Anaerolineales bacterium]
MKPKFPISNYQPLILCFLVSIFIASCAAPASVPTPQPFAPFLLPTLDPNAASPTPFQPGQTDTPVPTFTASPSPTSPPTATPTETATPPTAPTAGSTIPTSTSPTTSSRSSYILYATLDFANRTISADQTIRYYNTSGSTLSDLVLSVQPNHYTNTFALNSIAQDGTALTSYALSGQRLSVNLTQALASGSATTITLNFSLSIPAKGANDVFGYDFNQINLVDWYPFIVPYRGGWILHDSMPWGEHLVYDAVDIELNIKTDTGVTLAVGASPETNGEWTRYRLYGARTLAVSASDEFLVSETMLGNVSIRSYYFNGYKTAGQDMATYASEAIATYSSQFAPYPHQTLAIVQTDMDDGQEYDGLVFLATDFYSQYNGTARSNLTTIGVHEIAHQWWFSLVGNDQSLEPWLDEALATYSERIFYENNYPANISWWWQFRINYFKPTGYVDATIYDYGTFRTYTNAVYFQGALFLDDLREQMGYGNFSKFIQAYASRYSHGHATAADFFALARETVNVNYDGLIGNYFSGSY